MGKLFRKTDISFALIRTCTCLYQGVRNVYDCIYNFSSQTLGGDESQKKDPQIGGKSEKQREWNKVKELCRYYMTKNFCWFNFFILQMVHSCFNQRETENTHGGVLLLLKLKPEGKSNLTRLHGCFSRFLNCEMILSRTKHHKYKITFRVAPFNSLLFCLLNNKFNNWRVLRQITSELKYTNIEELRIENETYKYEVCISCF